MFMFVFLSKASSGCQTLSLVLTELSPSYISSRDYSSWSKIRKTTSRKNLARKNYEKRVQFKILT